MPNRFPFEVLPTGWYAVATSDEVRPGSIVERHYFEQELAVYRTEAGEIRVIDAHCPHMGAHLGKVGRVEGERLVCGFHGFEYATDGRCVATAYQGQPPRKAVLHRWPVREQNGLVLVWYDAWDREPAWCPPVLDQAGYTESIWRRFRIATHPQETSENSVDFGHFTQIHGLREGQIVEPVKVDGSLLTTAYRAMRPMPFPSWDWFTVPLEYDVSVWGLGYSQVDIRIPTFRQRFRLWILSTPVDREHVDTMVVMAARKTVPPVTQIARYGLLRAVCAEVGQDLDVWTYKKYIAQPALAKGDGPIAEYRRYASQFYRGPAA